MITPVVVLHLAGLPVTGAAEIITGVIAAGTTVMMTLLVTSTTVTQIYITHIDRVERLNEQNLLFKTIIFLLALLK